MSSLKPTLLIAEDDASTALVVSDLARSLGWQVVLALDGEQALHQYEEQEPDLVLLDYMMPLLDGFEVLDRLRQRGSQVPIIIATASTEPGLILEALRLGATDFLRKPFEHLLLLRNILGRENRRHRSQRLEVLAISRIISHSVEFDIENDLTVASGVCHYITRSLTDPESAYHVRLGLEELIANAIEHGNLGFSREDKTAALGNDQGSWTRLIAQRAATPPWSDRRVRIVASLEGKQLEVLIQDAGSGFDHRNLPNPLAEENLLLPNGRGIFLARQQFDEFEYLGKGNLVRVRKLLSGNPSPPKS